MKTQTIASSDRASAKATREFARDQVATRAKDFPELFAKGLAANPLLANGLRELSKIVDSLIQGGQREVLLSMLDSRTSGLSSDSRIIISERLLLS